MIKTALFFGSFNPIHVGHFIIADYILEHSDVKSFWFVITPSNPLKIKKSLLDEKHRLYMVKLAIEDDMRFRACDIEFQLEYPSYTCNTLIHLSEKYKNREFVIIMGEDNYVNFDKWKNWEFILNNYNIIVYPRIGNSESQHKKHSSVTFVNAPRIEISSTFIRESIKEKKSVRYMLLPVVAKYIEDMNFYK